METKDTILIVDDGEVNRAILKSIFESKYKSLEAENGAQAMQLMEQYKARILLVLLDLSMPIMDGYHVMREMSRKGYISEIPVIIITADNSSDSEIKAFDEGASDVIMKPFEAHIVQRRVQNVVELNRRKQYQNEIIEEQAEKIRRSNAGIITALASIIEARSLETGQHVKRIGLYLRIMLNEIAKEYPEYQLDQRRIETIVMASALHDIGKISIPDAILSKPGRLTPEEFEIMKTHTVKGCEMINNLTDVTDYDYLQSAYMICRYHHERWDGRGYPDHLEGDAIPISAQAAGIADCYDALTNDRVYKKAIDPATAIHMIENSECGSFNPKILKCLDSVSNQLIELANQYAVRS